MYACLLTLFLTVLLLPASLGCAQKPGKAPQHGLRAEYYGGTRPVANNRDPEQRPHNRRVEIVVR